MEEDARISQLRQRPRTHILQLVVSLRNHFFLQNHFSLHLHSLEPVHPMASPRQWAARGLDTSTARVQIRCCTHYSSDLLGFPFLFLEGLIIDYCQARRCCPLAFSPAERGLVERGVPGWAWPGAVPGCPAGRCRARRGHRSARFSAGPFRASTPRRSGRLQNPHDVRWELLQHARRREPFQPLPGTSHNRSCQLRRDAALPARPARCAALPARSSGLPRVLPAGRVPQPCIPAARLRGFPPAPALALLVVDP